MVGVRDGRVFIVHPLFAVETRGGGVFGDVEYYYTEMRGVTWRRSLGISRVGAPLASVSSWVILIHLSFNGHIDA